MDEGGLLFAIVLALGLICGAKLLADIIAFRLGFKPLDKSVRHDCEGDWPRLPDDLKTFHAARYSEGVQHGRS